MSTRSSAGGAGAARGTGNEPRIFAWFAAHALARQRLPEWLAPNARVLAVGLQTAYAMDDGGVRTEPADEAGSGGAEGRLFIQSKSGLTLSESGTSDLAAAIDQAVAQWHVGIAGRRLEEKRDRLVIVTDAASSQPVQKDLYRVINNRLATAPDEPAGRNSEEETALRVLRGHVERAWRAQTGREPGTNELANFHGLLRLLVLDLDEGKPGRTDAENLLRPVLAAPEQAANVWESLTVIGQGLNERQQWYHRRHLIWALRHRSYALSATALDRTDKGIEALLQAQVRAAELFPNPLIEIERPTPAIDVYVRQTVLASAPTSPDAFAPQPFNEVLARSGSRHFLVLGEAGLGKSTLTRQEAARLAQRMLDASPGETPRTLPRLLPLWVSALDLAEAQGPMTTRILTALVKALGPHLQHKLPEDLLATAADEPWLLLIDGLDEISDPVRHLQMLKTLAAYARQEDGMRMVITTRALSAEELKWLGASGFGTYALQRLDHRQLTDFAHNWFGDESAATRFLVQANRPELRDLVRVPLMATLAAMLHKEDPERALPRHRYTLYDQFLNLLREARSSIPSPGDDPHHSARVLKALREQKEDLVHHLAQVQISGSSKDLLPEAVDRTKRSIGRRETRRVLGWSERVAKTLTDTGLFVRTGSGLRIVHMSFAEHLAAEAHAERLPARFDAEHPDWLGVMSRALSAQSRQDTWAQSSGMDLTGPEDNVARDTLVHHTYLHPQTAAELVRHLQTRGRNGQLLAGYLLGEGDTPTTGWDAECLISAFIDHLRDAVHREGAVHCREERLETWFHVAGRIPAPLIGDYLHALAKDRRRPTYGRVIAARALADSRPQQAIEALRSILDDESTDPNIFGETVRTLIDIDPAQTECAADALRRLLNHRSASPESICRAAETLASLGETYVSEAAAKLLMSASNLDAAPSDRLNAARLLGDLGPAYRQRCVQALWGVVDAPDTDVFERTEAMRELSILDAEGADEVAKELLAFLTDEAPSPSYVRNAAEMIVASSPHRLHEVVAALRTFVENPAIAETTRTAAESQLRTLLPRESSPGTPPRAQEPDPSSPVEEMCRVLADPEEGFDRLLMAAEALSELGLAEAEQGAVVLRGRIAQMSMGPDLLDIALALAELGPAYGTEVAAILRGVIAASTTPSDDRVRATHMLLDLGPQYAAEAFGVLRSIADDASTDEDTRDNAIRGMGYFRPEHAPQAAEYLRGRIAASECDTPARRRVLAEALGWLGPLWAAEAAHSLRGIMNDTAVPGAERVECAVSLVSVGQQYEVEAIAWLRGFMKDPSQAGDDRDLASHRLLDITGKYLYEQDQVMRETSPELYAKLSAREG
ncbi:NACHT domain-containing protein [Streptomyces rochei]|uniref:NACHT domain-containing protein n=1 Tax=Streptomyces rochei TaxID=1928 RepID=UPI0036FEE6FC